MSPSSIAPYPFGVLHAPPAVSTANAASVRSRSRRARPVPDPPRVRGSLPRSIGRAGRVRSPTMLTHRAAACKVERRRARGARIDRASGGPRVTDPNGAAGSSGHEHPARQSSLYASKSTSRPRRVGATLRSHVVENAYGSSENALLFGTRRSESSMNDNLDPKADLHPLSLGIVAAMGVPVATAGLLGPVPKALAQPGEMEEVVVT